MTDRFQADRPPCEHLDMNPRDTTCPTCHWHVAPMKPRDALAAARASLKETQT